MFPAVVWAAADLIPRQIHPPALYARPVTAESDQMGQSLQHCSADALYTGGTERNRPCALLFPRTQAQRGQQKRERELSVLPAPFTQSCFHHSFAPFPSDRAVRRTAGVEGLETWGQTERSPFFQFTRRRGSCPGGNRGMASSAGLQGGVPGDAEWSVPVWPGSRGCPEGAR